MRDYLDKIDEIMQERRNNNPLNKEFDRLTNEIYPIKAIEDVFKLGYCKAMADLKNNVSTSFSTKDKEIIDEWITLFSDLEGYKVLKELIK